MAATMPCNVPITRTPRKAASAHRNSSRRTLRIAANSSGRIRATD
jgi:hypothetical protein